MKNIILVAGGLLSIAGIGAHQFASSHMRSLSIPEHVAASASEERESRVLGVKKTAPKIAATASPATPSVTLVTVDAIPYAVSSGTDTQTATTVDATTAPSGFGTSNTVETAPKSASAITLAPEQNVRFSGMATPLSTVMLYIHSDPFVATTQSDNTGAWTYVLDRTLDEGEHSLRVSVVDSSGAQSDYSDPVTFSVTAASTSRRASSPVVWSMVMVAGFALLCVLCIFLLKIKKRL